jgi:hypothetical protein
MGIGAVVRAGYGRRVVGIRVLLRVEVEARAKRYERREENVDPGPARTRGWKLAAAGTEN